MRFKKNVNRKHVTGIVVVAILLLSGYASQGFKTLAVTFCLAYDSEEVIHEQYRIATITSSNSLEIE